jgi:hypothetical protein
MTPKPNSTFPRLLPATVSSTLGGDTTISSIDTSSLSPSTTAFPSSFNTSAVPGDSNAIASGAVIAGPPPAGTGGGTGVFAFALALEPNKLEEVLSVSLSRCFNADDR